MLTIFSLFLKKINHQDSIWKPIVYGALKIICSIQVVMYSKVYLFLNSWNINPGEWALLQQLVHNDFEIIWRVTQEHSLLKDVGVLIIITLTLLCRVFFLMLLKMGLKAKGYGSCAVVVIQRKRSLCKYVAYLVTFQMEKGASHKKGIFLRLKTTSR